MKRFTATEKWEDEWFQNLPPKLKCLWQYLCDKADYAGVWAPNFRLASFQIGEQVDEASVTALGTRVTLLPSGKYLISKFIPFQYGKLSRSCPPHNNVFDALEKHGLLEKFSKGLLYPTGRVTDRAQEEEEEEERGGVPKPKATPTLEARSTQPSTDDQPPPERKYGKIFDLIAAECEKKDNGSIAYADWLTIHHSRGVKPPEVHEEFLSLLRSEPDHRFTKWGAAKVLGWILDDICKRHKLGAYEKSGTKSGGKSPAWAKKQAAEEELNKIRHKSHPTDAEAKEMQRLKRIITECNREITEG